MQADAGCLNHVQAAEKPGGWPGRLGTLGSGVVDTPPPINPQQVPGPGQR